LDKLHVGISSWIIQDGNYPDFEVGQIRDFALEFGLIKVRSTFLLPVSKSLRHIEAAVYEFEGELVFRYEDVAVLDVGVFCFDERPSKRLDVEGRWFSGERVHKRRGQRHKPRANASLGIACPALAV